ncbi:hypothetical protein IWX83_003430 [Flavobacterium sp. CG_9.1]|uniref:type IV toxin-antitoxin system AbiEi family antitoxin domain-containing protein n=1 Tax=Flavobacterium sp. CG_9.1 TaxID=2787728 RepID=UPI0018C9FF19|nr:hypothetical protein [Flavobacterium sp. CG_9.1]MBG6063619.1 hypothetical protein [Flavobacterium sp. CG_9.1]
MDFIKLLSTFEGQPITHQILTSILHQYKRPNDKIKALKEKGIIKSVKRGIYIPGENTNMQIPESSLIANHIYGPSYISMETALSHYNLIPERVYAVTSMTIKPSKDFRTSIGLYSYSYLPLPYYAFGIKNVLLQENQRVIMSSPEKALADKIGTTPGVILRSMNNAQNYVFENLRMEQSDLKDFDTTQMRSWLSDAPKKESLEIVIRMIEKL